MNNLTQRYREVVEFYNDNYAHFLTDVLSIGKPMLGSTTETACIVWNPKNLNEMTFEFNPDFMDELSTEQLAFVMAHETLHVVLNHPTVHDRLHKAWGVKPTDPTFNQTFNIAADVIINDLLLDAGFETIEDCFTGESTVGASTVGQSVTDVFNKLYRAQKGIEEIAAGGQSIDDHGWMQDPNAQAASKAMQGGMQEKPGDTMFDDVIRAQNIEEGKLDKLEKEMRGKMAGDQAGDLKQEFIDTTDFAASWADILEKIEPEIFVNDKRGRAPLVSSFHARRRKLYGPQFKNIHLPVTRAETRRGGDDVEGKDLPIVIIALDVSGSIDQRDVQIFVKMVDNIPQDKISVRACTFDTRPYEYKMDGKPYVTRGGTNFNAIAQFINKTIREDPACKGKTAKDFHVIALTDGCAGMSVNEQRAQDFTKWNWIMPDKHGHYMHFIKNEARATPEQIYYAEDMIRR